MLKECERRKTTNEYAKLEERKKKIKKNRKKERKIPVKKDFCVKKTKFEKKRMYLKRED